MMEEAGFHITADIFRSDFLGRSFASASHRAAQRFGRPLPGDFEMRYRQRLLARMETDLMPMQGVEAVLRALKVPFCLATSSTPQRLAVSLRVTGLQAWFEGRCFTASEVAHGKPAPDLLHHAAGHMGADAAQCIVIEDSEMGVRAAKAAAMPVWHFSGGAHVKAGYSLPDGVTPDRVIGGMDDLRNAFSEIGLC
jgi:HAD superfamily hydrolase (TIGR01509 family)